MKHLTDIGLGLALLLCACSSFADVSASSFPDMVGNSVQIVRGVVHIDSGAPVITVTQTLKGDVNPTILLDPKRRDAFDVPEFKFLEDKEVLLFLQAPGDNGLTPLLCCSAEAKWPQPDRAGVYGRADLAKLEKAVDAVQMVFSVTDPEQRAQLIITMLNSKDELTQLVGLETVLSENFSKLLKVNDRAKMKRRLAAFAIPLLASSDSGIRGTAIQLVGTAPTSVVMPAVIPMLEDADVWCRRQAKVALGTAIRNSKIKDESLDAWLKRPIKFDGSDELDTPQIKAKLENEWNAKKTKKLEEETPYLKADKTDKSRIARDSADIYLKYLGVTQ